MVQLGKSIAFMEGVLFDATGAVVAKATASARLVGVMKKAPALNYGSV